MATSNQNNQYSTLLTRTRIALGCLAVAFALPVSANGYGVFEAQTQGLGGAGVALASSDNAVFYNPALLAQYQYDEDSGRNGRFYFPAAAIQIAEVGRDIFDLEDEDQVDNLSNAIDAFNLTPGTDTAASVVDTASVLNDSLSDIQDRALFLDSFAGMAISEPGDGQGGAFYWGVRAIGGGDLTNIEQTDLDLLEDYIEALDFVASGGTSGEAHPELFNGDGTLVDPRTQLTSTATAGGAVVHEIGIGAAKEFTLWGVPIALGITPKLLSVKTYDAFLDVANQEITTGSDDKWRRKINGDIGVALRFDQWRIGLAVKDIVQQTFTTPLQNEVTIDTKSRLGVAYQHPLFKIGLDVDLTAIDAVAQGPELQEAALGGEWRIIPAIALRAGYRQDITGNRDDIISYGVGFDLWRVVMDFSVAESDDEFGAALQIGFKH